MKRLLAKLLVFAGSCAIGAFFVFYNRNANGSTFELQPSVPERVDINSLADAIEDPSASHFKHVLDFANESFDEQKEVPRFSLGRASGLDLALQGLDEGTINSLLSVQDRFLEKLPDFRIKVLPLVRRRALHNMVNRFKQEDWLYWLERSFEPAEKATEARNYVNRIIAANNDLGLFLDSSAVVFQRLIAQSERGYVYDLESDLLELVVSGKAGSAFVPREIREYLSSRTLQKDPVFLLLFERLREFFVLDYIERNPKNYKEIIALLDSLKPQLVSQGFFDRTRRLLKSFAVSYSAEQRLALLDIELKQNTFLSFAPGDDALAKALGELYALGAIDALESGYKSHAQTLYDASIGVSPGLEVQFAVNAMLVKRSKTPKLSAVPAEPPKRESEAESDKERGDKPILFSDPEPLDDNRQEVQAGEFDDEIGLFSTLAYFSVFGLVIISMILALFFLLAFFAIRRNRKAPANLHGVPTSVVE